MAAPTLVLFCGPPAAGKTSLARRLEAAGRGIRLGTDDWQHAVAGWGDDAVHERLQRRFEPPTPDELSAADTVSIHRL